MIFWGETSEGALSLSDIGTRDVGSKEEMIDNKPGCFIHADKTMPTCK